MPGGLLLGVDAAAAGGGGPPLTGLVLWLKADAESYSDGASVPTWHDQSGNGNDAAAVGTPQAIFKAGIINGLPIVRFARNDGSRFLSPLANTQPYTVFVVANETANAQNQYLVDGAAENSGAVAFLGSTAGFPNETSIYCGGSVVSATTTTTSFNVISAIFNTSSSAVYINGTLGGSGNPGSSNTTGTTVGDCGGGGASVALMGDIAEVLIYNSALSSTVRSNVENYLLTKYAL